MHPTQESTIGSTFGKPLVHLAGGLFAAFALSSPVLAQLTTEASYPLLADVLDTTANYGPVTLTGNPTPPAAPANGVCVNGIYSFTTGGQDVRTPQIANLNTNDFQLTVEFNLAALPATMPPVLMGGSSYRWLGTYVQSGGAIGLKHNNSNLSLSTTNVTTGRWYLATVKFEAGTAELHLDGLMVHQVTTGSLNTGNNLNFTTNDFSNGRNHNGCIRNLVIANDTTLGNVASATNYGSNCGGIIMNANGLPTIGNATFGLTISNTQAGSPLLFLALGASVNPGIDLGAIGMAGCFSYTNLGLGVLGPVPAAGGVGAIPLTIPNNPTLAGLILFTQGIAFSSATQLGLASSNATMLIVGL